MGFDLKRPFLTPFTHTYPAELIPVYLIATAVSLGGYFLMIVACLIVIPVFAISLPFIIKAENWIALVVMGGLYMIYIFAMLAITSALPMGYALESAKLEASGAPIVMPHWGGNFLNFFKKGFLATIIIYIYIIALFLFVAASAGIIFAIFYLLKEKTAFFAGIVEFETGLYIAFALLGLISAIGSILISLILPMLYVNFSIQDKFIAAFDFVTVFKLIFKNFKLFLLTVLTSIALLLAMLIPLFALSFSCVGLLLSPLVFGFIFPIILFNIFAQLYKSQDF
jgi:hypothetical protein